MNSPGRRRLELRISRTRGAAGLRGPAATAKRQAGAQPSGRDNDVSGSAEKEACAWADPPRRKRGFTPSAHADSFDHVDGGPNRGDIANHRDVGKARALQIGLPDWRSSSSSILRRARG